MVSTPCVIRPDLILAVLTANNVIYEDEACPPSVMKHVAFWWDSHLKEDFKTYDDGQAAASHFRAQGTFQVRKLVQASASACQREADREKKPPSHLKGKQIAAWKAQNDPDSIEAQLAPKGAAASTTTYSVSAPPPPTSHPPPDTQDATSTFS